MPEGKIKYAMAKPPDAKELAGVSVELFIMHIEMAFGRFPIELGADQLDRLEGMKVTATYPLAFDGLIRAIKRYGSINVWVEHAPSADTVRAVLEKEANEQKAKTESG